MTVLQDNQENVRDRLMYDPVVKGYDQSFWKTTGGTPSTSSNNLRLNTAEIASYSQYIYGDYEFKVNIATTPSVGEAKVWGLRNPATSRGAIYFEISGATFQAVSVSDDGNTTDTTAITWNQHSETWNGNMTTFRIVWDKRQIKFYVGADSDNALATHTGASVGSLPLALRIDNDDADNMDVDFIIATRLGKVMA